MKIIEIIPKKLQNKPEQAIEPEQDQEPETKPEQKQESEIKPEQEQESEIKPYFQAIGIIKGKVTLAIEPKQPSSISIQGKTYNLYPVPSKQGFRALEALQKEIEVTGNSDQRLIVYPKITHFPGRDKPHDIGFQLVGFDKGLEPEGITADLSDFEFKLCGLWQFIPVCQVPCISVFKNFTHDRNSFVKEMDIYKKVKFMKGSHCPILWKDAPFRPFRFNPKAEKEEQGKPIFVSVKAKFLPARNVFGFDSLVGMPLEKAPNFFKANKDMKAEALKASLAFKKEKAKAEKAEKKTENQENQAEKPENKVKPKPKIKA